MRKYPITVDNFDLKPRSEKIHDSGAVQIYKVDARNYFVFLNGILVYRICDWTNDEAANCYYVQYYNQQFDTFVDEYLEYPANEYDAYSNVMAINSELSTQYFKVTKDIFGVL
jgi:hypothetical protein